MAVTSLVAVPGPEWEGCGSLIFMNPGRVCFCAGLRFSHARRADRGEE